MSSIEYCVDDIRIANLKIAYVSDPIFSVHLSGYKNILGVEIIRDDKIYFYSINDDCIFNGYIDGGNSSLEFENNKLYAAIYNKLLNHDKEHVFSNGSLYLCSKGPYYWRNDPFYCGQMLTKQDIIDQVLFSPACHFSDVRLVSPETTCDYRNQDNIERFLITTEDGYYQYKKRRL